MNTDVLRRIYQHPGFSTQDLEILFAAHRRETLPKGTFLLKKGAIANDYHLVEKGLIRHYLYDYEGNEITTAFVCDGEIVIEVASIFHRVPTQEYIQCLTDCVTWKIAFDDFQELFRHIPALPEWGRAWLSHELHSSKMRATEMITVAAAQRYLNLMEKRPKIVQQAPLKHIASYLGVTDTSLSRIRKELKDIKGHGRP